MISILLLATAAQSMPTLTPQNGPACRAPIATRAGARRGEMRPRPLGNEPAARGYRSVMRFDDGCEKLVPVSGEPIDPPASVR